MFLFYFSCKWIIHNMYKLGKVLCGHKIHNNWMMYNLMCETPGEWYKNVFIRAVIRFWRLNFCQYFGKNCHIFKDIVYKLRQIGCNMRRVIQRGYVCFIFVGHIRENNIFNMFWENFYKSLLWLNTGANMFRQKYFTQESTCFT